MPAGEARPVAEARRDLVEGQARRVRDDERVVGDPRLDQLEQSLLRAEILDDRLDHERRAAEGLRVDRAGAYLGPGDLAREARGGAGALLAPARDGDALGDRSERGCDARHDATGSEHDDGVIHASILPAGVL